MEKKTGTKWKIINDDKITDRPSVIRKGKNRGKNGVKWTEFERFGEGSVGFSREKLEILDFFRFLKI